MTAYKERKNISLNLPTFDKENALKLYGITKQIVDKLN